MKIFRSVYKFGVIGVVLALLVSVPAAQAGTFPGANGKIAFSKTMNDTTNIWLMNQNGDYKQQLTDGGASSAMWSPDGRKLVFVSADGGLQIMNSDGSNQRQLTWAAQYTESSPVWSADGSRIAFVRQEKSGQKRSAVFTIRPDGGQTENVSGWPQNGGYRAPSWAPDGQRLVYERFGQGPGALLIRNTKNSSVRQLTSVTEGTMARPAWSPNGTKILFNDSPNEVYTIWPDGSHRTVISDGDSYYASWSPDGTTIVFVEDLQGDSLSIGEADGTVVQVPLQKGAYEEIGPPSWSPNGTKLLLTMASITENGRRSAIFSLNLSEGNAMLKLATGQLGEPNWQAKLGHSE